MVSGPLSAVSTSRHVSGVLLAHPLLLDAGRFVTEKLNDLRTIKILEP